MLTCVCRPVSGNLPKMPPTMLPAQKMPRTALAIAGVGAASSTVVVTAEPKLNVPGRLTSAELRAMALRQQQQIDSQHQLLATKEQRLRFLKSQEVRNAVASAEGERLRRLRERVEAQESKLRRLRALRGQVDLQKTYNVTLSNDLDSIRALFSEKEKELSLAVAKVEALTRQLEELRRDRRCPVNLLTTTGNGSAQPLPPQASRELEKLRRELVYRNQLSLQQDARLHLQREALQQRQAELRSVDQRIYELQTRLQRKKATNLQIVAQNQNQLHVPPHELQTHQKPQQLHKQHQPPQTQHHQQQQTSHQPPANAFNNNNNANNAYHHPHHSHSQNHAPTQHPKQGVAALKQQLLQKQAAANLLAAAPTSQQHTNNTSAKFSNIMNRETNRSIPRGNVAAVEPYIHTPQKTTAPTNSGFLGAGNILKHAAATANTNQQNQLIQDLTHVKLNLGGNAHSSAANSHSNAPLNAPNFFSGESDESKLAKKMLTATLTATKTPVTAEGAKQPEVDSSMHIYAEVGPKKRDILKAAAAAEAKAEAAALAAAAVATVATTAVSTASTTNSSGLSSKIPKSISTSNSAAVMINKLNNGSRSSEQERRADSSGSAGVSDAHAEKHNQQQLTVHSMPLGAANKSLATPVAQSNSTTSATISNESQLIKPKPLQPLAAGNLAVPPRKPISSVAPTTVTSSSAIPKMITYSPKVNRVAPHVVATTSASSCAVTSTAVSPSSAIATSTAVSAYPDRPALPPKPSKMSPTETHEQHSAATTTVTTTTTTSLLKKPAAAAPPSADLQQATLGLQTLNINDNLPIKAKPLTIRKQPMCEQPRLKSMGGNGVSVMKPPPQATRKLDMPSTAAFLYSADSSNSKQEQQRSKELHESVQNARANTVSSLSSSASSSPDQPPQYSPPHVPAAITTHNTAASQHSPNSNSQSSSSTDELDKIERHAASDELQLETALKRRTNASTGTTSMLSGNGKPKLARRVSFDPLALLLDASLEGELELVKKTAMQVANPSAANDEGITALHNAICAGHFDIVKFLVEFGCDVNAQDSDGWTPLHCAASCNNLSMVKFLVESGACLFASTLSDHETPAEKCEEDEEGFDGCSEYLYSIQEKLGILHNGEVYAVFSYDAQNSDELTFQVNDRLIILRKGDDAESEWWWAKNANDEEGYVPRNLLGLYPRVPPQTSNFND